MRIKFYELPIFKVQQETKSCSPDQDKKSKGKPKHKMPFQGTFCYFLKSTCINSRKEVATNSLQGYNCSFLYGFLSV